MRFRRQSRMRMHSEMKADSLSDIMFFLMLFFLIMSTMIAPQVIKITLPKASAGQSISKRNVILSVNAEKKYFIDKNEIVFENLETELSSLITDKEEITVVVRADKETPWQNVVDLISIGNKLKLKVVIATEKA